MKSAARGRPTSVDVEVTNISANGFWLLLGDREVFLPFQDYPWFREASIGQVLNVERPSEGHLHWPELDVDLAVESIDHPERYPLVSSWRPGKTSRKTPGKRQSASRRPKNID